MRQLRNAIVGMALATFVAGAAHADCYVDYKAKRNNPLRLAYGVSQVSERACNNPRLERAELAPRLGAGGWTLLKILSSFGPEGLAQRKANAGAFFLRY